MSRYSKKQTVSQETQSEAKKLAKANQRPGQTKEQTRLIAQGIQKGIEQYKKQHKAKSRELDKRLKTAQSKTEPAAEKEYKEQVINRQHWLPWVLLLLTWSGVGVYYYFS
ncbi:MAG: DUF2956 domain-containing protein [Gammaproteobacteria bacterium]|nr:DUF2956 domain-containing protein [Gammaproteobacteria bacterium]